MTKRLIIVGAGEAGRMVIHEIASHPESDLLPVGFIDDDPDLLNQSVEGLPVLGASGDLPAVAAAKSIDEVLIAVPSAGRGFVRRVIAYCRDAQVSFKIVPGLIEIIKGPVHLEQIRDVHPEDLLGRETVEFDESNIRRALKGKKILVTGGGGSIGGELCRQIASFQPERLFVLGRGENQVHDIEIDLSSGFPALSITTLIADIRDRSGLIRLFKKLKPDFVYHAAAHKHVHYMESFPSEAVKNNIFGTDNVMEACEKAGVERLVMLSTDKAVRPRGVMGATKRAAEYLLMRRASNGSATKASAVRFGNVLGSRGSVVPLFIKQIREGGPVTISDPEASRFFMTLREACMLVVQASIWGKGGEIFILRMGSPIKILELAKDLIALHGFKPGIDIKTSIVGLRPGEKLNEDLVAELEEVEKSKNEYIFVTHPKVPTAADLDSALEKLKMFSEAGDDKGIRAVLNGLVEDAELEG